MFAFLNATTAAQFLEHVTSGQVGAGSRFRIGLVRGSLSQ
jgi:hypothetical protein